MLHLGIVRPDERGLITNPLGLAAVRLTRGSAARPGGRPRASRRAASVASACSAAPLRGRTGGATRRSARSSGAAERMRGGAGRTVTLSGRGVSSASPRSLKRVVRRGSRLLKRRTELSSEVCLKPRDLSREGVELRTAFNQPDHWLALGLHLLRVADAKVSEAIQFAHYSMPSGVRVIGQHRSLTSR